MHEFEQLKKTNAPESPSKKTEYAIFVWQKEECHGSGWSTQDLKKAISYIEKGFVTVPCRNVPLINAWKIKVVLFIITCQYTADAVVTRVVGCATFCSEHAIMRDV